MNVETFLENFGHLAEAPGGIQRLQEMILELAVQGKLTEQNPTDGTGGQQVAKADEERRRLVTEGVLRKTTTTQVSEDEIPFEIPQTWAWSRLAAVGIISPRNDVADNLAVSFVPMKLISDKYGEPPQSEPRDWSSVKSGFTHFAEGDVALAKITPCFQNRKSTVMRGLENGIGAGTTELHIFRPLAGTLVPEYVVIFLKSRRFIETGVRKMTGSAGQKRVPKDYFSKSPFPVPPLAEQHRIVAKVDELMALCDELESQQQQRRAVHVRASEAALDQLTTAASPTDFNTACSRIRDHFDLIYSTPETIAQLRTAIIQLAVQGKLVCQQPEENSAENRLNLIATKRKLLAASGVRLPKVSQRSINDQVPFSLPAGWKWVKLGRVTEKMGAGSTPLGGKKAYVESGIPFLRSQNVWNDGLRLENVAQIPEATHHKMIGTRVKPNDVLLNITGASIGRCSLVSTEFEDANVSQHVAILRLIDPTLSSFLHLCITSPYFQKTIMEVQVGVSREGLSMTRLREFPLPIPPENEQHRIIHRVNELFSLCDALLSQLSQSRNDAQKLTNAIVRAVINDEPERDAVSLPSGRTVPATGLVASASGELNTAIGTISCYTVNALHARKHFGRTPHAKLLSLTQSHLGIDLAIDFQRQEHGPYHPCILELEATAKANKWYRTKRVKTPNGKTKIAYTPGGKLNEQVEQAAAILGDKQPEMNRLLALFAPLTTRNTELYTTAYFVWNDFLIDGTDPTEAQIIEGFFAWHDSKRKAFKPEKVTQAIAWLRENELIPSGKGRHTVDGG